MATKSSNSKNYKIEDYSIDKEPFYVPVSDEIQVFESAYNQKVPILLKGPTGTGKTRFVEYMSWYISSNMKKSVPLIRSANSGISAVTNENGKLIKKINLNKEGFVEVKLLLKKNQTFFETNKNYSIVFLIFFVFFLFYLIDIFYHLKVRV